VARWLFPRSRRHRAVRRLGRIGSADAVTALVRALDSASSTRAESEFALRTLESAVRDQPAIDALCAAYLTSWWTWNGAVKELIRNHGWRPADPNQRAMILYVTEIRPVRRVRC